MKSYIFTDIEKKWNNKWEAIQNVKPPITDTTLQKRVPYYMLNMFPYPSGAGLHVGHYTGYVASDIVSRYRRHKGYHVMNPMGFDAFGLPAEQYAIQTGQPPALTIQKNSTKYIAQLKQVALDFDWDRMINTSDPSYYKWTQWIFLQMFHAWYNTAVEKAEPIATLILAFEQHGNSCIQAYCDPDTPIFSAEEWHNFSDTEKQTMLLHYRLAYLKDSLVNWCEALGTVLANEEVKDGYSERGGYPVTRKKMKQWHLRMTAYTERLLMGLDELDWPLSTKEMQRNWIGRSEGAEITFRIQGQHRQTITVFTTRPETIFGACFIALAPEHPWVTSITTQTNNGALKRYIEQASNRTERSRLAESSFLSGVFVNNCVIHPFTGAPLPIWVADYVLPNYGTGAIMGVPAHDRRDYAFAQSFDLLTIPVIESNTLIEDGPYEIPQGRMINSDFLNGLSLPEAKQKIIQQLTQKKMGKYKIYYKLSDPVFSRQRYWGEPFPIYYKDDGLPYALTEDKLPLVLPTISNYKPNPSGKPPLSNACDWKTTEGYPLDTTTMPGWAGSSWYFLRYMDPNNSETFLAKDKASYWKGVNCYIGGAEHATGHLLYARFWSKLLYDLGHIPIHEPFPKLFHQGTIQSTAALVYRIKNSNTFVSFNLREQHDVIPMYIPPAFVEEGILQLKAFKNWRPELTNASFILENKQYICGQKMEKMSKSKYNVINPDNIIAQYGADALRLYLMFLGPLEQSKPWDITGIEGMVRFLNKVWRLVHHNSTTCPSPPLKELEKVTHKTIKKVTEDIERFAFNTAISSLMVYTNLLTSYAPLDPSTIETLLLLLAPFAPYITAELWENIGKETDITTVAFPCWEEAYITEDSFQYPIAINGKIRTKMVFDRQIPTSSIEKSVLANPIVQKWLAGKLPSQIIIVPNRIVNIVLTSLQS